jgi:hypothetical protein
MRPTGDPARNTDLQGWPHVDRTTVAVGSRRPSDRGVPPTGRACRLVRGLTGQTAEAQRWAALLDAASFDSATDMGTSFDSARRMLRAAMCSAGPEQMLSETSIAMAQEPPWSPWRDTELYLNAEAHLLTGNVDQACALFAESSSVAATNSNADCWCSANPSSHWWRWIAGDGTRLLDVSTVPLPLSRSIECTTTPPVFWSSPWRRGTPCTAATWIRLTT